MSHQFTQNTPIRKFKEIRSHSHQIMKKKTIHTHSSNLPKLKINNKNLYTFLKFFIPEQHLAIGSGQALSLSLSLSTHTHTPFHTMIWCAKKWQVLQSEWNKKWRTRFEGIFECSWWAVRVQWKGDGATLMSSHDINKKEKRRQWWCWWKRGGFKVNDGV